MRKKTVYRSVCMCIVTLLLLSTELSVSSVQSHNTFSGTSSDPASTGWLTGWEYRKGHTITNATGAGADYPVQIQTYYGTILTTPNSLNASISDGAYLAENIVYDFNTSMYWWIFEDRSSIPAIVRIAYATSINGPWTVQETPIMQETGHYCISPCIAQFGSYWFLYYGRADSDSFDNVDVWVQRSSHVNQSYSTSGTANPVLARGGSGSWDSGRVFEPYIYFESGVYYLFYMGQDGDPGQSTNESTYERTGYATSSFPTSGFVKYSANPILPADNWPHEWDAGSDQAADPFVFKHDNIYYIGVSAVSSGHSNTGQIGFYTSKDLINFTYYGGNPVLSYGRYGDWDTQAVARGAVTDFNGTLYFAYSGYDGTNWGCGLTTLTISSTDNGEQVFLNGKCRTDFGDLRFTGSDGTTLLNYWIEGEVDNYSASFWVQVSGDLSSTNQTIYVYYGNDSATTTSNGYHTFLFFDDFSGNLSKWTNVSGTWAVENGDLIIKPGSKDYNYLVTANSLATNDIAIRTRMKSEPAGSIAQAHPGLVWHANNLTGTQQRNDQMYFRPHMYGEINVSEWSNIQPSYATSAGVTWHDMEFGSYLDWNTWYTVEVQIPSSGNVSMYGHNSYWGSWGNQQYTNDHVGFVAHDSGQDYWDYILVRKYVNTEPLHRNWGSEERGRTWQMTFNFYDMDNNTFTSRVTWQLFNGTQLLNYTEGENALRSGTYTLKTMIDSYVIDASNFDTATYGNSTANVTLSVKQQNSTLGGYIALNCTASSLTVHSQTATNLTFALSASPGALLVKVPHNAEYIKENGLYIQTWTWDYPQKVILLDSTNSTYEFNFLNVTS